MEICVIELSIFKLSSEYGSLGYIKRTMMTPIDYKRMDARIEVLRLAITGLENSISVLQTKFNENDWYDGFWLLEESEPIYGLAFIAIQNYINSSIYDKFESLENQYMIYKRDDKIENSGRTKIELIVSIANYFKHRDHPSDLKGNTAKILTDLNLMSDTVSSLLVLGLIGWVFFKRSSGGNGNGNSKGPTIRHKWHK